jgi:hypothetical protein
MKIFYLTRLFSGLEKSFKTHEWSPTGVPTIYRIIEKIDNNHDVCLVFTVKDSGIGYSSSWSKSNDESLFINGLNHKVTIISGVNFFPNYLGIWLRKVLREIRQVVSTLYKVYKFKPDVFYCDHANVIVAAILSRVQKKIPVVFRVMGVNQFMRASISKATIYHRIYYWAYRSPFSLVICTQDGSGLEEWTNQALSEGVSVEILLNGVDSLSLPDIIDEKLSSLPCNKIIIMFVGKIEIYKGCYEFVQAILNLITDKVLNVHALIIGNGTEKKKILKLVRSSDASSHFTFIKSLPHAQILYAHSMCDIYVSMNYEGNLSNANLEAIQANDCIVMPEQRLGIDIVTNAILKKAVLYTPIQNPKKLSIILNKLINSKKKRVEMSRNISIIKKNFLWSWDERIDKEMNFLKNIVDSSTIHGNHN